MLAEEIFEALKIAVPNWGRINATPMGVRLSAKLQLTAALCNEIWPQ